jgi:hypothetical protein
VASDTGDLFARAQARRDAARGNALGALRSAAERRDADQERAVRLAADNLLDKALRRLGSGDEAGARNLVDRALRLSLEGSAAGEEGALAVHLFVWDALRGTALSGKQADWVHRAEDVHLDDEARREWFAALRALAAEGELTPADQRRIRGFSGGAAVDHEPFAGVEHAARVDATLALLRAVLEVAA